MIKKTILPYIIAIIAFLAFSFPCYASSQTNIAKTKYLKASSAFRKLARNHRKQKYRSFWLECIKKYQEVYEAEPKGPWAAAGLYKAGILYYKLYKRSFRLQDRQNALDTLESVRDKFPKSRYWKRAATEIRKILSKKPKLIIKQPRGYSKPGKARKSISNKLTTITGIRFWSNPNYTRVVIDADNNAIYANRLLKRDMTLKKPQRLYVDIKQSTLDKKFSQFVPINDDLLKNVRAARYTLDTVRVVIDIKSFKNYKIFSLKNPFRIVIDVWGDKNNHKLIAGHKQSLSGIKTKNKNKSVNALARQLALGVHTIVIDPGHGGRDYGAPGYLKGVHEKNIALQIAKRLSKKIKSKLHCRVIMTRNKDKYLTLEERTAIANTKNADLFISLHANASRDRRAYGVETYFLNLATDEDAIRVAAKENATSTKNISDLQSILSDLMQNAKINESSRLATSVETAIYKSLKHKYKHIKNKGVKQAPFYVLLGAQMPSILIETAFISNPRECRRLKSVRYQNDLCNAILKGIKSYINETNPTAFLRKRPESSSKG